MSPGAGEGGWGSGFCPGGQRKNRGEERETAEQDQDVGARAAPTPAAGQGRWSPPGGAAEQLLYKRWLALIPLTRRVFRQSGISSAPAQSSNPVKGWVAMTEAAN